MNSNIVMNLSGERFKVWYRVSGEKGEAYDKALAICLEQTVEFPRELVPEVILEQIVGRIESFDPIDDDHFMACVSYAVETAGGELTQLLNVIFGNISIKPGIRVERIELSPRIAGMLPGPVFGREGLRRYLGVPKRPLLCTALKPMGLSAKALGELAYQFAVGGIDIIKDDHGLANQPMAPFSERVKTCSEAVQKANHETGRHSIYMPNITSSYSRVMDLAREAKQAGAGGLLIAPGITGLDVIRELAAVGLPIFSHPALQGSYVLSPENGFSHYAFFGQLTRMSGADGSIFPNFGGRFSFSREECRSIAQGAFDDLSGLKPIFPVPGGGMTLEKIPEMLEVYGRDIVFLIGGGLHQQGRDLMENCSHLLKLAEAM